MWSVAPPLMGECDQDASTLCEATIEVGDRELRVRSSVASSSERDRLHAAHSELMPGFAEYEKKTDRKIPVVLLEPLDP